MSTEAPVQANTRMEASRIGARLFRNNRGMFYTVDAVKKLIGLVIKGDLAGARAMSGKQRIVRAGLEADGSSDLVGDFPVTITQEMVGMTLAVALYAEVKEPNWKKPTDEHERVQLNFITQASNRGALAFFITDHKQLKTLIETALKKMIEEHKKKFDNLFDKDGQGR